MIVCSCNRLSDKAIRGCCATAGAPVRVLDVYGFLGCRPQCGRCATSIAAIIRQTGTATCSSGCGPETCKCETEARGAKAA
jgi:bacterioferritin-associated ferredoxin